MDFNKRILLENQAWASRKVEEDPGFFERLAIKQVPYALWIGCADSRVPAELLCNADPGELFIFRNVANIVSLDQPGCASAIEYAVHALEVKHIIVCGHHLCGGIKAAMEEGDTHLANVDNHLVEVKKTRDKYKRELEELPDDNSRINRLVELNVIRQIEKLSCFEAIKQAATGTEKGIRLHGMVYALEEGLLREIAAYDVGPDRWVTPD